MDCYTNRFTAPAAGDTDVPTNTLLWGYAQSGTRLLGPAGNEVAADERRLPVAAVATGTPGAFPVLVPREPLEPDTDYTIELDSHPVRRIVFTTSAGPARGAPELPVLLSSEPRAGAGYEEWSIFRVVSLRFEFDGILIGDTGQLGDNVTIDGLLAQGDANLADPTSDALPMIQWVSRDDEVSAGISDCGVWPSGASDIALGRFAALDLAGNFSGWTPVPLALPSPEVAAVAAAADLEARRTHNIQQGRPPACAVSYPGASGTGEYGASRIGWLALATSLALRWRTSRMPRRDGGGASHEDEPATSAPRTGRISE